MSDEVGCGGYDESQLRVDCSRYHTRLIRAVCSSDHDAMSIGIPPQPDMFCTTPDRLKVCHDVIDGLRCLDLL